MFRLVNPKSREHSGALRAVSGIESTRFLKAASLR